MKRFTFILSMLFIALAIHAQFTYTPIKTDGFELSDGMPDGFTRTGQAAWSTATPSYTGGFWDLIFASSNPKDYVVASNKAEFHSGEKSIKISTMASIAALRLRSVQTANGTINSGIFGSSETGGLKDWGYYKVSLYAKGTAGTQLFSAISTLATGGWDKYEFTTDYSSGQTGVRLMLDLKSTNGTSADIYIDDLLIEQYASAVPTTENATSISSTGFTANWVPISGAVSYRLVLQSTSDAGVTWTSVTGYPLLVEGATATNIAISGLTAASTYRYKITGFDGTYYSPGNFIEVKTSELTGINESRIRNIYVKGKDIYLTAEEDTQIDLITPLGRVVKSIKAVEGLNVLSTNIKGVLFVKSGKTVSKVVL